MHIPTYATTDLTSYSTTIVGIQGPPGSGKTVSGLTFPNPLIALFEKPQIKDLIEEIPMLKDVKPTILKFYDADFVTKDLKQPLSGKLPDHGNAFLRWLTTDALKLTPEQTLLLDNWTRLNELYDKVNWAEPLYPTYSKGGDINEFAPWQRKIDFCENVSNALIALNCNVVVLFHEIQEREPGTGRLLDKIQALQQGKFVAKLKSYYPNFFRQHARTKKGADGKPLEPRQTEWLWQTRSSDSFDAKCSRPSLPALIDANYNSLIKP